MGCSADQKKKKLFPFHYVQQKAQRGDFLRLALPVFKGLTVITHKHADTNMAHKSFADVAKRSNLDRQTLTRIVRLLITMKLTNCYNYQLRNNNRLYKLENKIYCLEGDTLVFNLLHVSAQLGHYQGIPNSRMRSVQKVNSICTNKQLYR
jgi:hypothetical protein